MVESVHVDPDSWKKLHDLLQVILGLESTETRPLYYYLKVQITRDDVNIKDPKYYQVHLASDGKRIFEVPMNDVKCRDLDSIIMKLLQDEQESQNSVVVVMNDNDRLRTSDGRQLFVIGMKSSRENNGDDVQIVRLFCIRADDDDSVEEIKSILESMRVKKKFEYFYRETILTESIEENERNLFCLLIKTVEPAIVKNHANVRICSVREQVNRLNFIKEHLLTMELFPEATDTTEIVVPYVPVIIPNLSTPKGLNIDWNAEIKDLDASSTNTKEKDAKSNLTRNHWECKGVFVNNHAYSISNNSRISNQQHPLECPQLNLKLALDTFNRHFNIVGQYARDRHVLCNQRANLASWEWIQQMCEERADANVALLERLVKDQYPIGLNGLILKTKWKKSGRCTCTFQWLMARRSRRVLSYKNEYTTIPVSVFQPFGTRYFLNKLRKLDEKLFKNWIEMCADIRFQFIRETAEECLNVPECNVNWEDKLLTMDKKMFCKKIEEGWCVFWKDYLTFLHEERIIDDETLRLLNDLLIIIGGVSGNEADGKNNKGRFVVNELSGIAILSPKLQITCNLWLHDEKLIETFDRKLKNNFESARKPDWWCKCKFRRKWNDNSITNHIGLLNLFQCFKKDLDN